MGFISKKFLEYKLNINLLCKMFNSTSYEILCIRKDNSLVNRPYICHVLVTNSGFGLVIEFIDHLSLVTTGKYNRFTDLVVPRKRIPGKSSSAHVFVGLLPTHSKLITLTADSQLTSSPVQSIEFLLSPRQQSRSYFRIPLGLMSYVCSYRTPKCNEPTQSE
jgi:hypothetical protein